MNQKQKYRHAKRILKKYLAWYIKKGLLNQHHIEAAALKCGGHTYKFISERLKLNYNVLRATLGTVRMFLRSEARKELRKITA